MKLNLIITAIALSGFSLASSATNLGVLTVIPQIKLLTIAAPDVDFSAKYLFSLQHDGAVSAGATNLPLVLGGKTLAGISDFSLKLFDSSDTLLATGFMKEHTYRIDDFVLPANNYYFQVAGETTGAFGGSYSFVAWRALPVASVPEPSSLALLAMGLVAIGIMRTRAGSRQ